MSDESKVSLKQDLRTNWGILKLCWSFSRGILPVVFLLALVEVASPFVNIILPARILAELLGGQNRQQISRLILITAGINLVLHLLYHLLANIKAIYDNLLPSMVEHYRVIKCTGMDYEHVENPEAQNLLMRAYEGQAIHGQLESHITDLGKLFKSIITLVVAIVVSADLFKQASVSDLGGIFQFLASPLAPLCLLLLLLATAFTGMYLANRASQIEYQASGDMIEINRLFRYLIRLLSDYRFGKDIRIYHMAPLLERDLERQKEAVREYFNKITGRTLGFKCLSETIRTLTTGLIYLYVAMQAFAGAISVSNIMLYTGAIFQLNNSLSQLADTFVSIRGRSRYIQCYLDFLDLPPLKYQGSLPVEKRHDHQYEIEFRNVSFRYPGSNIDVLNNVSFKLRIGEKLAVVGMNGAGKTTFIKLLCRLYDPTEGEILLNGIDIRKYNYQEYLQLFGVVFQDFQLFPFPVGQNVAASLDYDAAKAISALDQAGVGDRVRAMPQQTEQHLYKDYAADGVEISGGEAQKIAIARAIYKNAPFIILDEPTAALDPIAEFDIYSKFDTLVGERTSVYISHRLSSCRFCHDIAVFDKGRIIQRGSHEELLTDTQGKYAELWNAQAQYYTE